ASRQKRRGTATPGRSRHTPDHWGWSRVACGGRKPLSVRVCEGRIIVNVELDVATIAALIGEPTRAAMLGALLGGLAIPAGELAAHARVTPRTASAHLTKLVEGALLDVRAVGRRRYYRIANPRVGAALEALAVISPPPRSRTLGESEQVKALR